MALDVDGTLLGASGVISPAVRQAVTRAGAHAPVVVATGRTVFGTRVVLDALGLRTGSAISSNGAVRVDVASGAPRALRTFDPSAALTVLDEVLPGAAYGLEQLGSGHRLSGEFPDGALGGAATVVSRQQLVQGPTTRAVAWWPEHDVTQVGRALEGVALPGATGTLDLLGLAWLTVVAEGVSKASGLAVVAAEMGVDAADVLAIGDGTNDVEMLAWAGRGVVMGQAPAVVHTAADHVTGSVDDDGAATELTRWF